ncbi:MAG: hypothetical protein PHG00_01265 [Methylococcales bacterium]|nr:hypothetical protein [Methylococcales bacterium]
MKISHFDLPYPALSRGKVSFTALQQNRGLASFLFFPVDDTQHQMFLMFMLAGLSADGMVAFSADLVSAVLFSIITLVPIIP